MHLYYLSHNSSVKNPDLLVLLSWFKPINNKLETEKKRKRNWALWLSVHVLRNTDDVEGNNFLCYSIKLLQ